VYPVAVLRIYRQEITGRNYRVTITQTRQYNKTLHTINIYIGLQSWTKISVGVGVHDNNIAYDELWVDYRVNRIYFRVDKNTQWAIYAHINHVHHCSGPGSYTNHFTALQTYLVHYTSLPFTAVHCTSFTVLVDTALHQHNLLIPSRLTPSVALPGLHFPFPCFEFVRVTVSYPYRPFW